MSDQRYFEFPGLDFIYIIKKYKIYGFIQVSGLGGALGEIPSPPSVHVHTTVGYTPFTIIYPNLPYDINKLVITNFLY